jgi:hypothetical protein
LLATAPDGGNKKRSRYVDPFQGSEIVCVCFPSLGKVSHEIFQGLGKPVVPGSNPWKIIAAARRLR